MKIIFKIAKTELRILFYSPIAWFIMIVFLIQCAITYTGIIDSAAKNFETYGQHIDRFTYIAFSGPFGMFSSVTQNLYLYIPLLTMGLISRELNGGTIKLLYSSPIKIHEIVFGKYLAMLIFNLILVLLLGVFIVAGVLNINSADFGMLLSAELGFYLLLCAYAAIGLFMSSISNYQVVAAISTFIMIGFLSYVGRLWQGIDFVRDLTYFLSISGRMSHMLIGLITTKDVIYFAVIVYMFLGFAIFKLKNARESKPLFLKIGRYVIIMGSALIIGYISSRPLFIGYWDTTTNNDNTLTPDVQKVIKDMGNSPLEVTLYSNMFDDISYMGAPERHNDYLEIWEPFLRFKPDIKFQYVNYYDIPYGNGDVAVSMYDKEKSLKEKAKKFANINGWELSVYKTPEEIHQLINLKPEQNRLVMQLKYKGKTTFLRVFSDTYMWPSEAEISAAFKRLLQAKMPKIAITTGNGERNIFKKGEREYKYLANDKSFRYALINQGFDVDTLNLDTKNIPDTITALVIADPQVKLSAVARDKIQRYRAKGGNLVIVGEPGRQQLINPILMPLGVQMLDGILEQKSADYSPLLVFSHLTKTAIGFSKLLDKPSIDTLPVSTMGVAALSYKDTAGYTGAPLLTTALGRAYTTMARNPDLDMARVEMKGGALPNIESIPVYEIKPDNSNLKSDIPKKNFVKTYTTAVALTRRINGKEQRIFISGDADFLSNKELDRDKVANFNFSNAIFCWLSNGKFPIDTSRPDSKDNGISISSDHVIFLKALYIWVLPALLLIFGTILLIRRKRK